MTLKDASSKLDGLFLNGPIDWNGLHTAIHVPHNLLTWYGGLVQNAVGVHLSKPAWFGPGKVFQQGCVGRVHPQRLQKAVRRI